MGARRPLRILAVYANEAPGRPEALPWLEGSIDQIRALRRREARRVGDILGVRDVRFIFGHPCGVATGPDEILAIWYAGGATRTAIHSARLHID